VATEIRQFKWDDLYLLEDGPDKKVPGENCVRFLFGGETFEIDLSDEHYTEYLTYMTRLAEAGRIVTVRTVAKRATSPSGRGRHSHRSPYLEGLREYFASTGRPLETYKKKGTNKPAGFKYTRGHYDEYNRWLTEQGRADECMTFQPHARPEAAA
jgi:hypothetical protein